MSQQQRAGGEGRLLTGESRKESQPIAKTHVRTPSHVHAGDLPVWSCTLAKHPSLCSLLRADTFLQCHALQALSRRSLCIPSIPLSSSPLRRMVACSATCRFHLIHTSLGIHVFSFTLSLSLPFSHAHTLMASSRSITHSLSDYLGFSCSQSSLKHATSRQHSHIHCARCHQASLHSRHDNASKLDSYAPNPTLVPGVSLEGRNEAGGPL